MKSKSKNKIFGIVLVAVLLVSISILLANKYGDVLIDTDVSRAMEKAKLSEVARDALFAELKKEKMCTGRSDDVRTLERAVAKGIFNVGFDPRDLRTSFCYTEILNLKNRRSYLAAQLKKPQKRSTVELKSYFQLLANMSVSAETLSDRAISIQALAGDADYMLNENKKIHWSEFRPNNFDAIRKLKPRDIVEASLPFEIERAAKSQNEPVDQHSFYTSSLGILETRPKSKMSVLRYHPNRTLNRLYQYWQTLGDWSDRCVQVSVPETDGPPTLTKGGCAFTVGASTFMDLVVNATGFEMAATFFTPSIPREMRKLAEAQRKLNAPEFN